MKLPHKKSPEPTAVGVVAAAGQIIRKAASPNTGLAPVKLLVEFPHATVIRRK